MIVYAMDASTMTLKAVFWDSGGGSVHRDGGGGGGDSHTGGTMNVGATTNSSGGLLSWTSWLLWGARDGDGGGGGDSVGLDRDSIVWCLIGDSTPVLTH